MKKFEVLEHTADLRIRVFGRTKEELFKNAVLAMMDALQDKTYRGGSDYNDRYNLNQKREIKIKSTDLEALLVDFLSEALYLSQVNKEVYTDVKFKKFSDTEIEAELRGKKVERFGQDIKAVTYHGLDIFQGEDGFWQATILFDI